MENSYEVSSSEVDVLIVGAGPTGLMAAANLVRFGFSIKIIDKATGPTEVGRAVYFQSRTCEILDQMGLVDQLLSEAYTFGKIALYEEGKHKATLDYSDLVDSEFRNIYAYGQAGLENILIRDLKSHDVEINRSTFLVDFEVREGGEYPVFATLTNICGQPEIVFAKYMIGADGAHSFIRRKLGLDFDGVRTTIREAAFDAEIESDTPDLENIILMNSNGKSIHYIPRGKRNGHWYTRIYTSLPDIETDSKHTVISEEVILEQARLAFAPYTFTLKNLEWFYIYEVTERVISSFGFSNRIFMAGDSCHCHSAKAGLAINSALSDSHNICWKLFWYEKVRLGKPMLLESYSIERRAAAQDSIEFSSRLLRLSAGIRDSIGFNSSYAKEMSYAILKHIGLMNGCEVVYGEGSGIMKESDTVLGGNFKVIAGQRAPFGKLINADGEIVRLYRLFVPDNVHSRFTLLILLNSITEHLDEFTLFVEWVENFKSNLADNTTVPIQSLLGVIVAQTEIVETSLLPRDQLFHDKDGELREKYGASDDEPAIFVIRPDGYIGTAWLLSETSGVDEYFKQILDI